MSWFDLRCPMCVLVCSLVAWISWAPVAEGQERGDRADHGWLSIFTTYGALITVDGEPYPRRSDYGMKLEANEQHEVLVKMGDKQKTYTVVLEPREQQVLMVDLTGYQTGPEPASKRRPAKRSSRSSTKNATEGKLTVYSKPRGEVVVDGSSVGSSTPMINHKLDVGRHEVQVKWEDGQLSEVKTIRIRKGSRLKLFFRDRRNRRR